MIDTKEIQDNLWQVGGDDLSGPGDAAIYLVRFGPEAALIDAGCGQGHQTIRRNIAACLPEDIPVSFLILTHCHYDHSGGAARLREELGCRIVAHVLDAVYLETGDSEVTAACWYGARMEPLVVDVKLDGPDHRIEVGDGCLHALHMPGHSPGSLVLTTRMEDQLVLFGQDVHGPIHPALRSDRAAYQASLRQLLDLEADLLLEGHFGVFRGKERVRRFVRSFII
ncbi:MAG: MBL fold metallo-hydrolase [Thermodesulfobacteriota bacterium]